MFTTHDNARSVMPRFRLLTNITGGYILPPDNLLCKKKKNIHQNQTHKDQPPYISIIRDHLTT